MNTLSQQMDSWGHPRLLVVGDLMLDRYTSGDAERVSPEAPVLVLRADAEEIRLGGAASVAALLRGLEADVSLAGVVGTDASGRLVRTLLREDQIDDGLVLCESDRRTTTKDRFLGRSASSTAHQMLRVDHEDRHGIRAETQERMLEMILDRLPQFKAVLVSDYAKGVCTAGLLEALIVAARQQNIPVMVDPGRGVDFEQYRGASAVKPNRMEAQAAAEVEIRTPQDAIAVGKTLCSRHGLDAVIITLDRDGMVISSTDGTAEAYPTMVRQVCNITGAGDMALATLGLCLGNRIALTDAVQIANIAAGLEVERQGIAPVTREELALQLHGGRHAERDCYDEKLVTLAAIIPQVEYYRRENKTIVFTNGCFDLLHIGHVKFLQEAATRGDVLIVAINSDDSVRNLKGSTRPIINQHDRAAMLGAVSCVDHVLIFDEATPHAILTSIRPDILVKGGTTAEIIGREIVERYGGRVFILDQVPGISTSRLITSIKDPSCA